jgi:maleylacetoacetate isomerase
MMVILYTYWRSSAAFRARIALNLKGIRYEPKFVHLMRGGGEQHSAEYRAVNPQGRVPVLVHEGRTIVQSMAILEYLEETFPQPALLPADPAARARVRSIAQIIVSDVQPLQNTSVTQYLADVLRLDEAARAAWLKEWITRGMAAVEQLLAESAATGRFCHGDAPTLADCCLFPQVYSSRRFGVDPAQFPRVSRIAAECQSIQAFVEASPESQPDRE